MCGRAWDPEWITPTNRLALRDKVVEMFTHAYTSYMDHAYPADELMPIACKGRIRGVTVSRGDVDDTLGNFSLTLIDTLDTLAVLGMFDEFEEAVYKVEKEVRFDADLVVSVFETNIRVLGGLLGGHAAALEIQEKHDRMKWYNGSLLLMAKDIGDRLLPAFNTSTGIPMSRVNLATGAVRRVKDKDTCTACAGTMILEMAALSRFTGDPVYEEKARKAMDYLWSRRQRSSDLMGTVLSVSNGEWIRKESGIGAGIDSYYEYLLKAYILYADEEYLERFNAHYSAIKQYIKQGPLLVDVHMHKPNVAARSFMDALGAFWPGLQVLKGDLSPAIENHELLYQVFQKHKFLPEAFTTTFDIYWGQYPLRPEFAESTYLLHKATADPYYLEVGKMIVENLEKHARVKCGYAGIKDVRTFKHEDRMDSYFLAEMFKYLYLLFSPDQNTDIFGTKVNNRPGIDIENYLLTTEAHLMPLYLSNMAVRGNGTQRKCHSSPIAKGNTERFCPNSKFVRPSDLRPLQSVRRKVKKFFRGIKPRSESCQKTMPFPSKSDNVPWSGPRQLLAKDFEASNGEHIKIIGLMGITTQVLEGGSIQLEWHPNMASTVQNAKEGQLFMYEMEELRKHPVEVEIKPLLIQFLSQPYLGAVILKGGPAQFGPDMSKSDPVSGAVTYSVPLDACSPLTNPDEVKGKIALAMRGNCMFIEKTRHIEEAGGVAAILIDNNAASEFGPGPTFTMAGDGETETKIPAIFLFTKEAKILRTCVNELARENRPPLEVLIGQEAKSLHEVILEYEIEKTEPAAEKAFQEVAAAFREAAEEGTIIVKDGKVHVKTAFVKVAEPVRDQSVKDVGPDEGEGTTDDEDQPPPSEDRDDSYLENSERTAERTDTTDAAFDPTSERTNVSNEKDEL